MEIRNKVLTYIKEQNLLAPNDSVICAVSGGADSVCMLDLLVSLKYDFDLTLYVVHLNHCLRGNDADRDEEFVKKLASSYGLPCFTQKTDVGALANTLKVSCEEAGRIARYDFFNRLKRELSAGIIATAHNKNDNIETVLMRIFRGTDIKGLSGISPMNDSEVIRPVLCLKRSEIEEYIECKGLDFVTDKTNLENDFTRNKIRNILIPHIEDEYNKSFIDTMSSNIDFFREADEFIEKTVNDEFDKLASIYNYGISFDVMALSSKDSYIVKKLIKKAVFILSGCSITNRLCDCVYKALSESGDICINSKIDFYTKYEKAYFVKKRKPVDFSYKINSPGTYHLPEISSVLTVEEGCDAVDFGRKNILYIDADLPYPFVIRSRKDGDKMILPGCGTKKVKDIFIDEKIPSFLRDEYPVLEHNNDVIWLIGVRDNGKNRAKNNKKHIKITIHKENNNE